MVTRSLTAPELTAEHIGKFIDVDRPLDDGTNFIIPGRIQQVVHAVRCATVRVQLWNDDSIEVRFVEDERPIVVS